MDSLLEAKEVVVGNPPSPPISVSVQSGEILGLLFPPNRPRLPLLRALAGVERPVTGNVRYRTQAPRVALVGSGSVSDAFDSQPELLLIDGETGGARDDEGRGLWARLAAERECGMAVVIATEVEEQAYRSDRVSLAMWQPEDLVRALETLSGRMHQLTNVFLDLLKASQQAPTAAVAARLRRLSQAAKDLLAEWRRQAHDTEEVLRVLRIGSDLAADSVDDRVLEALIAQSQDI